MWRMANPEATKKRLRDLIGPLYDMTPDLRRQIEELVDAFVIVIEPSQIRSGESVSVALRSPKTAALLYDRVWTPDLRGVPISVTVYGRTDDELALRMITLAAEFLHDNMSPENAMTETWEVIGRPGYARWIAEELGKGGIAAAPVYETTTDYNAEYRAGEYEVLVGVLQNVSIPVESELSWEQILELRADDTARRKVRRLKHWLDGNMLGRPPSYITEEIAIRLEQYDSALRKHGIRTVLGALTAALDAKVVAGGAAAVASLSYAADPKAAMFAGGAIIVGTAAVHLARSLLDLESTRGTTNPEIAFVAEIRIKGKSNA
jgi:hypothetical protein